MSFGAPSAVNWGSGLMRTNSGWSKLRCSIKCSRFGACKFLNSNRSTISLESEEIDTILQRQTTAPWPGLAWTNTIDGRVLFS